MGAIFSPSMMCANYRNIENDVQLLQKAGADRFHLDVMDGRFVPNFAMGLGDIKAVCQTAAIPSEVHLMIREPSKYIQLFAEAGADIIYIHPESDYHPTTALQRIIECGKKPGIVLNPGTSVESTIELLNIAKHVLLMCVNPGHAGQVYLPYVDQKIKKVLALKEQFNFEISIDGACSADKIKKWYAEGVDGFVLGTAALFGKAGSYQQIFNSLRALT